ncbi:MAG: long-chain fatty acid--CoA ligase [delta proteobacterium MLS_D]|nr:MAG: long-chain fatty acid--CoA ligase [delta proteobacterium MLS_D]
MNERPWHRHYDYNVPTTIRYPRISIPELLQIPANVAPDKTAVLYEDEAISFHGLRELVFTMAGALAGLGVKKGDRVGIQLPNCPPYLVAYWAVLSLGAIVVNINPAYTRDELSTILSVTEPSAMIALEEAAPVMKDLSSTCPTGKIILANPHDVTTTTQPTGEKNLEAPWYSFFELLRNGDAGARPRVAVNPEDPALIQFTGGTTGTPKGAVLTHSNLIAAVFQVSPRMYPILQYINPERRTSLVIIPLYHVYGNLIANWSVFNCSTLVLVPRFNADEVIDLLKRVDEITYFPAVPTMLTALINSSRIDELDLGRKIHVINSGAAPCPVDLMERLRDKNVFITEAWGMTETAGLGMANPILGVKKPGSIGIPVPDNDVKLVDPEDGVTEVPRGQPGEILIKGPSVMKEYWNNPAETANQLADGWLHTGDIAIQDEDDFFFIVDRKKDMIIAGGFNIYPREVDEVLYRHPDIQDAATVGVPDGYRGETVKAFVVLREGTTTTAENIIAFCREKLAPYKVPRSVEFRKSLPQSTAGKILRRVLRDEEIARQIEENKR